LLAASAHIAGGIVVWLWLGWQVHTRWHGWLRRFGVLTMIGVTVSIHWTIWMDPDWVRALVAIPMFLFLAKTWEIAAQNTSANAQISSFGQLAIWALCVPEGHVAHEAEERRTLGATGWTRIARGAIKVISLAGLLYLNQIADLTFIPGLEVTWMCFVVYITFSGLWDLIAGTAALMGISISPMFDAPPIARNPREFWGRRWNLWFTKSAHRLIFVPLGGRNRPLLAVSAVFVVSALLHEAIVMLGLKAFDGRMLVFFSIHGLATIGFTLLKQRWPTPWPRPIAVSLHFLWMVATTPLFMGPADDMMAISGWTLEMAINLGV